jgi:hypothetical protein
MPTLQFKNSSTPGATPSTLAPGELAVNWADKKAWVGNASNVPVKVVGSIANQEANAVSISGGTISVASMGTTTASTATVSTVSVSGTSMSNVRATTSGSGATSDSTNPIHGAAAYNESNKLRGRLKNIVQFLGSGTYTYTKTGPDVSRVHIICVGAGGGARAYSESGGAGGLAEGVYDATSMTTVTVTVGGGGGGGVYFGFSGQGGTSSFGSYCSATGGYGSSNNESHSGGHGGYGTNGQLNSHGGMGSSHTNDDQYSPSNSSEGQGGASYFGSGMMADRPSFDNGNPGVGAYGSGGIAVSPGHNGQGGRNGFDGAVIVYEYI